MAVYNNQVVEQFINELLDTKLPVEGFCNVDNSLVANEGDSIKVYRYSDSGSAAVVTEGNGNSDYSDLDGTAYVYGIKTVQDRAKVTDEELQRNSFVAEKKLDVIAAHIINSVRNDVVAEWKKSGNVVACTAAVPTFTELLSALVKLDLGVDAGFNSIPEDYAIFMSPAAWYAFQVTLTSNEKIEYELINGKRVPVINGVPVKITDELASGPISVLIATNQAVRFLNAHSVSAESSRNANTRTTEYYARKVYCPYLEFEKKVVNFGRAITLTKATVSNLTEKVYNTIGEEIADLKVIEGQKIEIRPTAATGYHVATVTYGGTAITADDNGKYWATVGSATAQISGTVAADQ